MGHTAIFVVDWRVVNADFGRGDPACDLARLGDAPHQARDKAAVLGRGQPIVLAQARFLVGDRATSQTRKTLNGLIVR